MRTDHQIGRIVRRILLPLNVTIIFLLLLGPLGQTGIFADLNASPIRDVVAAQGETETTEPPPTEELCGDGFDNDGDGLVDEDCPPALPVEPETTEPRQPIEEPPAGEICGDGFDNDGDGSIDEGCPAPSAETVSEPTQEQEQIEAAITEEIDDDTVEPEFPSTPAPTETASLQTILPGGYIGTWEYVWPNQPNRSSEFITLYPGAVGSIVGTFDALAGGQRCAGSLTLLEVTTETITVVQDVTTGQNYCSGLQVLFTVIDDNTLGWEFAIFYADSNALDGRLTRANTTPITPTTMPPVITNPTPGTALPTTTVGTPPTTTTGPTATGRTRPTPSPRSRPTSTPPTAPRPTPPSTAPQVGGKCGTAGAAPINSGQVRERRPVIVYLGGVGSDLSGSKAGCQTVEDQLRDRGLEYDVLTYSYEGGWMGLSGNSWDPNPYACWHTSQWIPDSVNVLREQLRVYSRAHPGSEFILVGHSQGGLIAWTAAWQGVPELAQYNSRIAAVVTFGSPLDRLPTAAGLDQVALSWANRHCPMLNKPALSVSLSTMLTPDENNAEAFRLRAEGVLVVTYGSTGDSIYQVDPGTLRLEADSGGMICNFGDHGSYINNDFVLDHLAIYLQNTFEGESKTAPSC